MLLCWVNKDENIYIAREIFPAHKSTIEVPDVVLVPLLLTWNIFDKLL